MRTVDALFVDYASRFVRSPAKGEEAENGRSAYYCARKTKSYDFSAKECKKKNGFDNKLL
jgi:hypothetical protein